MKAYLGTNPGDSIGNRRFNKESKIIHDGIGNRLEIAQADRELPDNLGNSIDAAPTHLLSGVTQKRKGDGIPHVRMGRYIIGGVNPIVAGLEHLAAEQEQKQEAAKQNPLVQSEKRLKRLFELEDDGRIEYTLTSTPEEKRTQSEQTVSKILKFGGIKTKPKAILESQNEKPVVIVTIKTPVFKTGDLPLAAFNFLVNKIVNRLPSDRIRLSVQEATSQKVS